MHFEKLEGAQLESALISLETLIGIPISLLDLPTSIPLINQGSALDCLDQVVGEVLISRYPTRTLFDEDGSIIEELVAERDYIKDTIECETPFAYLFDQQS